MKTLACQLAVGLVPHRPDLATDLGIDGFTHSCRTDIQVPAMMRKPDTDSFLTPATFAWQVAGGRYVHVTKAESIGARFL